MKICQLKKKILVYSRNSRLDIVEKTVNWKTGLRNSQRARFRDVKR